MSKGRVALVTGEYNVSLGYKNQLEVIFSNEIEIVILNLDDIPELYLGFDIILIGSKYIYEKVKRKAPLNAKLVIIIRNINTNRLSEIFTVENDSKALVVSKYLDNAEETVRLLKELGLNHIQYIPYCPDCIIDKSVLESVNLAITAGASNIVPKEISRVIELGLKVIDISTILEIIIHLGLPLETMNIFTLRYMNEFMALNRKVSDLQSRLVAVLDASSDGIIALDLDGIIIFKNNNLELFLSPRKTVEVGENISKHMSNSSVIRFIKNVDKRKSDVFKINGKDVMINKNYLKNDKITTGIVASFSYVSEIQNIEKEIRRKLSNKGNVAKYDFSDIIGFSKSIKMATDMTKRAARTDLSVLLLGENGTGKELFAQAIHKNSARSSGPFVAVNFAALPENLIESELFGYEEGAFTGAKKGGKIGLFELAHMGTIFLDEIGDATLSLQARLLRVIQEKEVLRIGGISPIPVDVRVIAATNKNLKEQIKMNLFRTDLYYRLNTITVKIPPLRERKEDIPYILDYYMNNLNSKKVFSDEAMKKLFEHNWPGNVRELENMTNYVVEIVDNDVIGINDLPIDIYEDYEKVNSDHEANNDIISTLKKIDNIKVFAAVLEVLEQADKTYKRASRSYLVNMLLQKNIPMTDNILRRILRDLKELQCIDIGNTRQGTKITQTGVKVLQELYKIITP